MNRKRDESDNSCNKKVKCYDIKFSCKNIENFYINHRENDDQENTDNEQEENIEEQNNTEVVNDEQNIEENITEEQIIDEEVYDDKDGIDLQKELEKRKEDLESCKIIQEIIDEKEKNIPKFEDIINTPMFPKNRVKLIAYYEMFTDQIPNTLEQIAAKEVYNKMLKEYKTSYEKYNLQSERERQVLELTEKNLEVRDNSMDSLKIKILSLETSERNKSIIYKHYEGLVRDSDYDNIKRKAWLKWVVSIPHDKIKTVNIGNITEFISKCKNILDASLYGMEKVKEQLLIYLTCKLKNPSMKKPNLGLIGPPGVGKTRIARLLSTFMDWGFQQISVGNISKTEFLKGFEYTYSKSEPGIIVKTLKKFGHKNGIIFFDELDKLSEKAEVEASLLHILDNSQNSDFRDNYMDEISIDLSHMWFIGSMNEIPKNKALADRFWLIKVDEYTTKDKISIVKNYIFPEAIKNAKLDISLDDEAIKTLIFNYTNIEEKGVRSLEKLVYDLVDKINFILIHQDEQGKLPFKVSFRIDQKLCHPIMITSELVTKLLSKESTEKIDTMYI